MKEVWQSTEQGEEPEKKERQREKERRGGRMTAQRDASWATPDRNEKTDEGGRRREEGRGADCRELLGSTAEGKDSEGGEGWKTRRED